MFTSFAAVRVMFEPLLVVVKSLPLMLMSVPEANSKVPPEEISELKLIVLSVVDVPPFFLPPQDVTVLSRSSEVVMLILPLVDSR